MTIKEYFKDKKEHVGNEKALQKAENIIAKLKPGMKLDPRNRYMDDIETAFKLCCIELGSIQHNSVAMNLLNIYNEGLSAGRLMLIGELIVAHNYLRHYRTGELGFARLEYLQSILNCFQDIASDYGYVHSIDIDREESNYFDAIVAFFDFIEEAYDDDFNGNRAVLLKIKDCKRLACILPGFGNRVLAMGGPKIKFSDEECDVLDNISVINGQQLCDLFNDQEETLHEFFGTFVCSAVKQSKGKWNPLQNSTAPEVVIDFIYDLKQLSLKDASRAVFLGSIEDNGILKSECNARGIRITMDREKTEKALKIVDKLLNLNFNKRWQETPTSLS